MFLARQLLSEHGRIGGERKTGLGGLQHDFHGFTVAHFTHENHLWRLPQRGSQGMSETRSVAVQFALMNRGALVIVQELDWILHRNDVVTLLAVDAVE